jgi:protein-disulfide isomerase
VTLPTLNRISLVLAVLGMFVAGTLSLGHILQVVVPCGLQRGCDIVTNSPYAKWFDLPVAYFGFVAYGLLAGVAIVRMRGGSLAKSLIGWGLSLSSLGLLGSAWLMYISFGVLKALCPWCLASAITMALIFAVHVLMWRAPDDQPLQDSSPMNFGLTLGLPILLVLGLGYQAMTLPNQAKIPGAAKATMPDNIAKVVAEPLNAKGPKDADVTVVEFLDFFCPACRSSYPEVMRLAQQMPTVRFAYRHFPLYQKQGHENALLASILSEYAAEKGKFWEFVDRVMQGNPEDYATSDRLFRILTQLGLDAEDARKRAPVENDPIFSRVYADLELANQIGIAVTPTFYVIAKGLPPRIVSFPELEPLLNQPEYQALIVKPSGEGPLAPRSPDGP